MSTLTDDDRANLAAFLDGELDEATSQALEAKLNRDPEARDEVEALRQAWSMLDFLPRPEPSPNFTNRTMERLTMVLPRAQSTQLLGKPQPPRWPMILAWGGAVLLALVISVAVGRAIWRDSGPPAATHALPSDEWLARQPKALREHAASLQGKARTDYLRKLHQDEQQRDKEWQDAQRYLDEERSKDFPARSSELSTDVLRYLNKYLWYMLNKDERERLEKAEGQWPLFPQTLVELADNHPPAFLGPVGFKNVNELPQEIYQKINKAGGLKAIKPHEGHWPAFAIAVSDLAYRKGTGKNAIIFPYELWATYDRCLLPPMHQFLHKKLQPVLTAEEAAYLSKATGKWPDFPRAIQELVHAHKMQPPWFTIPGPREQWDHYRIHKGP